MGFINQELNNYEVKNNGKFRNHFSTLNHSVSKVYQSTQVVLTIIIKSKVTSVFKLIF